MQNTQTRLILLRGISWNGTTIFSFNWILQADPPSWYHSVWISVRMKLKVSFDYLFSFGKRDFFFVCVEEELRGRCDLLPSLLLRSLHKHIFSVNENKRVWKQSYVLHMLNLCDGQGLVTFSDTHWLRYFDWLLCWHVASFPHGPDVICQLTATGDTLHLIRAMFSSLKSLSSFTTLPQVSFFDLWPLGGSSSAFSLADWWEDSIRGEQLWGRQIRGSWGSVSCYHVPQFFFLWGSGQSGLVLPIQPEWDMKQEPNPDL